MSDQPPAADKPASAGVRGRTRRAPFAPLRPVAVIVALFVVAAVTWTVAGRWLPGGRWLAVHLFTLGVVTNAVVAFSRHFATTLTHQPEPWSRWPLVLLNAGIVGLLVGMVAGSTPLVAVGGTVVAGTVVQNWWDIRSKRRRALGARFAWVIRNYERAHDAFVQGALLGVLLGTGVFGGAWYGTARLAHLQVNLLGWAGLTLLATVVFFGPTVLRVRIEPGADARARRWLPVAAVALTLSVIALLLTAVGGPLGTVLRLVAAAGLALYAVATVVVCAPVLRVARTAGPSLSGGLLRAACAWLPVAVAADALIVASGQWRLLDAVGLAVLVGVLAQSILGALGYVAPMVASADPAGRARIRQRMEWAAGAQVAVLNVAVVLLVAAAAAGTGAGAFGAVMLRVGWLLVVAFLVARFVAVASAARGRVAPG